jgi:hypothetical protein
MAPVLKFEFIQLEKDAVKTWSDQEDAWYADVVFFMFHICVQT